MENTSKPRSKGSSHRTHSPWEQVGIPARLPLGADVKADACVIGAGFSGLTAAYFLAKLGHQVVVIDSASVAAGESSATTAHLTAALDRGYLELERTHGLEAARLAGASHQWAIDRVGEIAREERIHCDYERLDGYLFLAEGERRQKLVEELEAARRCGFSGAELVERTPLPGFDAGPALRYPRQAQCHPAKYLAGLAAALERHGGRIYYTTEALEIEDGTPAKVRTRHGYTITANAVVVATNSPFNDRITLQTRIYPYRSYAIAAPIPQGSLPQALFWDTGDQAYHYVRLQPHWSRTEDLLIVGGEDHKTGQAGDAPQRFGRLEAWARRRFSKMGAVAFAWSGQVLEPADGLALIGLNPGDRHVYVITGLSGSGTTYGTIGGRIVADLISGKENRWADLYSPARSPVKGAKDWIAENLNVAARYRDYVTPGDVSSVDEIAPGSGAILRRGLSKIAVYKEPDGGTREFSAVCPHLGGIVCWNSAEGSWDCPLHGSRFDSNGEVLNGPAVSGLTPIEEPGEGNPPPRPAGEGPWTSPPA